MNNLDLQQELNLRTAEGWQEAMHRLEALLRDRGWAWSADLCQAMGIAPTENGKRQIRLLASGSEWIISGQKGYKHLQFATAEEFAEFRMTWMAQAKSICKRVARVTRNMHQVIAGRKQ